MDTWVAVTGSMLIIVFIFRSVGSTVAQLVEPLPRGARDLGSILTSGAVCVWSLNVLPMTAWVSFRCTGFLPRLKDVRFAGYLAPSVQGVNRP